MAIGGAGQDVSMGGAPPSPPLFSGGGGQTGGDPKQAMAIAQIIQLLRGGQQGAASGPGMAGGGQAGMGNLMQLLAAKQSRQPQQPSTSVPMGGPGGIQAP